MPPREFDVGGKHSAGGHPSAAAIGRDDDQFAATGNNCSRGPIHVGETAHGLDEHAYRSEILVVECGGTGRHHGGDERRCDQRIVHTTG